ncbi:MAG: protein kinase [Acidobacteria bacterium]|nr:protein kinase [Acidobacteriota bacterium]
MNPEYWQKIKGLLDDALKLDTEKREQFLDNVCGDDLSLRREMEELLASSKNVESFLEKPVVGEVAEVIVNQKDKLVSGQSLSHYKVIEQIGKGGMGEVYLAQDTKLHRQVALKVLSSDFAQDDDRLRRFVREVHVTSSLNHPNILTIHEIGGGDDLHFIASEYVKGETLRQRLERENLTLREILEIATQIVMALKAAHEAGIVHRDIKPENIMIREDGLVKVLDFGLAKLTEKTPLDEEAETRMQVQTQSGMILGTARYMSPEQARGKEIDERTDIFSFGIVLYEMLSGKLPFKGETAMDTIGAILTKEPAPLSEEVPPQLQYIVEKCLRKDREERYQTAKDLLIDLKNVKQDLEFQNKLERTALPQPDESKTQTLNATTSGKPQTTSSAEYVVTEIKQHKRGFVIGLSILLFSMLGFGYWFFANRSLNTKQIESIAVLPFVNESGNADAEYLSDGMTESLIGSLSQIPRLSVKARTSVFRYKGKEIDPKQIAQELSVQAILTGRVLQRGQDLTLYIELIDAATENVLWKDNYNRPMSNLVSLQSDIAKDVSNKLKTKLSGADEQQVAKTYTENAEAYQLYLKGRYYLSKSDENGYKRSLDYFQQAIDKDPNYALAYVGIADGYFLAADWYLSNREAMEKSKVAATRALELDDTLAEAHASIGTVRVFYETRH